MNIKIINGIEFAENTQGAMIPLENISALDIERSDLVETIASAWKLQHDSLRAFKQSILADIHAFTELASEQHGVRIAGKKGNMTLMSFDGQYRLQVSIANALSFNEKLHIAKELIDECITTWSDGANANITTLINAAFEVDSQGKMSTAKIFGLLKLQMNDETGKWASAMKLISDSVEVISSKEYVRLYERTSSGEYRYLSLDIAKE